MTTPEQQILSLSNALIKAEAYINQGRVHHAAETIITALSTHRANLASVDLVASFDKRMYAIQSALYDPPAAKAGQPEPETAA